MPDLGYLKEKFVLVHRFRGFISWSTLFKARTQMTKNMREGTDFLRSFREQSTWEKQQRRKF